MVVAVPQLMNALMSTTAETSELPRSMRPLGPVLDGSRQFTLLGSPHFLVHDGRVLLPATTLPLLDPIENILVLNVQRQQFQSISMIGPILNWMQ